MTPRPRPHPDARPIAGTIEVRGVLGPALAHMGVRIAGGDWAEGEVIATEAELAARLGVSRSVVREACRILGAKGMIRSRTSDGTRVKPRSDWRLLDPDVMDWRIQAGDRVALLRDLLTFRLVTEPGIALNATLIADDAGRDRIERAWRAKQAAYADDTLSEIARRDLFIETDIEFHLAFVAAVGSEILGQLFSTITSALELLFDHQMRARGYTDRMVGMAESHAYHADVYRAFAAGEAEAAGAAMRRLIQCAISDAEAGFRNLAS